MLWVRTHWIMWSMSHSKLQIGLNSMLPLAFGDCYDIIALYDSCIMNGHWAADVSSRVQSYELVLSVNYFVLRCFLSHELYSPVCGGVILFWACCFYRLRCSVHCSWTFIKRGTGYLNCFGHLCTYTYTRSGSTADDMFCTLYSISYSMSVYCVQLCWVSCWASSLRVRLQCNIFFGQQIRRCIWKM